MHRPTLATSLSICSLTAFAFDPCGSGWHGSSEIAPTITFAKYRGSGFTGSYYSTFASSIFGPYAGDNAAAGEFSLAGIEMRQSAGWNEWFTLDLYGSYAQSSVASGESSNSFFPQDLPASLSLWDMGAEAFTSISLDQQKEVWLEPAIGYSQVNANMKIATAGNPKENWERLKFYGPTAGLYLRLLLSSKISLRMGGGYMASTLKVKKYAQGPITTYYNYPYSAGRLMGTYRFHNRRHGLFGLARLDYLWKSWVRFYSKVDYRSYSSGGANETYDIYGTISTAVPLLARVRFSWGVDFAY